MFKSFWFPNALNTLEQHHPIRPEHSKTFPKLSKTTKHCASALSGRRFYELLCLDEQGIDQQEDAIEEEGIWATIKDYKDQALEILGLTKGDKSRRASHGA